MYTISMAEIQQKTIFNSRLNSFLYNAEDVYLTGKKNMINIAKFNKK